MNDDVKLCLDILEKAIAFEEEGMAFFQDRSQNAPSALERNLFRHMATVSLLDSGKPRFAKMLVRDDGSAPQVYDRLSRELVRFQLRLERLIHQPS